MIPIPPDIIDASLRIIEALPEAGRAGAIDDLYDVAIWMLVKHLEQAKKVIEEGEKKKS